MIDEILESRLRALLGHVLEANQQFNLTAVRDPNIAWVKHILDSLQGLETGLFEERKSVIDIGAGAGFPGLPLALARPHFKLTCLEATGKKCEFLRGAMEKFGIEGNVLHSRAETAAQNTVWRERYAIGVCRAVGALGEVSELGLPLIRVGGHLVLWRGGEAQNEAKIAEKALDELGGKLKSITPYSLPGHDTKYHLMVIEKIHSTPREFPRRDGLPKQKPLDGTAPIEASYAPARRPSSSGQRPNSSGQRSGSSGQRSNTSGSRPSSSGQRPSSSGQRPSSRPGSSSKRGDFRK